MSSNFWNHPSITRLFYKLKPAIPRRIQIFLRRMIVKRTMPRFASVWPIDENGAEPPEGWTGWPQGKRFALVITHDVESEKGVRRCRRLAEIEMDLGFRSSFNFVVKKYPVPEELRRFLDDNGFEVGVHGCYHDGKYFWSREIFQERARIINEYLEAWGATGFRTPSMLCNLDWIGELDIRYDLSTFDTDPFEPQSGGTGTIFPFLVSRKNGGPPFVEMPYTLTQDFTLFILLGEKSPDIWERKLTWIAEKGGMALVNTHPDYMAFGPDRADFEEYPVALYKDWLLHVKEKFKDDYYHCLPRELADFSLSKLQDKI